LQLPKFIGTLTFNHINYELELCADLRDIVHDEENIKFYVYDLSISVKIAK
jgi:hypothetical protein